MGKILWLIFLIVFSQWSQAYKPVVLWHGMGDNCCNEKSMGRVRTLLEDALPGVFVYSIQLGNTPQQDQQAGFFGVVTEQIQQACQQLSTVPELVHGFNAIGFSQGGLFLRAYVEHCNQPKVHRLITFGSPHGGVSDIPQCTDPRDVSCSLMRSIVRQGVYSDYVQHRIVQAQYYKHPKNHAGYLKRNIFLPDLNNERHVQNLTYKHNIAQLDMLVMVKFSQDTMIKPAETAWFWSLDKNGTLVPLQEQQIYTQDRLGLQTLGNEGRLKFLVCPGQHMRITDAYFHEQVIVPYLSEVPHLLYQQ
ncbi:Alpha/Beta hydrolase protein [Spinellus fusiger]|nr:Alpha/Beta hydrolase protein [Spinellus fusiger]